MKKDFKKEELVRARQNRYFSEEFKKSKVKEIENNLTKVSEICKLYEVSHTAVYKWVYKYSTMYKRQHKQIVEAMSDTKKIKDLQQKIKELEQMVGHQQMVIQYNEKLIDIAEEHYDINIKKNSDSKRLNSSKKPKKKGDSQ
jgi:transposase